MNDGLQGKDLQRAYWYNTHRDKVRTVAYGIAIGIVGIIWLINIVMLIRYFLAQGATNRAVNDIANNQVIYDSIQAPRDLTVETVDAVSQTTDTVDVYAIINNPNKYHVGHFNYTISVNGTNYTFNDGVIMPNAKSYLVASEIAGTATSSADIVLSDVSWERVRGPEIKTEFLVKDLLVGRSNLTTTTASNTNGALQNSNGNTNVNDDSNTNADEGFATPDEAGTNDNLNTAPTGEAITQVTGMLTNASAYGFRRVAVTSILKNPTGVILGVQQQVFTNMQSFSDYSLIFNWQHQFDFNAVPEIIVETNLWDDANLILPGQD